MLIKMKEMLNFFKSIDKSVPLKISLQYFVISFFWILLSDGIVHELITNNGILLIVSTLKGWVYIIVISIFLYFLLNKAFKKLEKAENTLIINYKELTIAHKELEAINRDLFESEEKLKQKYNELKVSEDRLNRAQAIACVGNWELDIVNQALWASEESFKLYDITYDSELIPLKLAQNLVHSEDRQRMDLALKQLISGDSDYNVVYRIIRHNDRQERIMHSLAKLEHDATGNPVKVLGVMRDITEGKLAEENIKQSHEELTALYEELAASDEELKEQFDQIHTLAYNDSVTGLPNRLWLQERLMGIIQSTSAKSALLFIDLDNFKNINDSFGHFFGDTVLVEMGKRLRKTVDENAFVARLGGDEFAIVITNVEMLEQVKEFAQSLLFLLETSFKEKDISIHLSASMGIAIYPDHANGFEELLKNADTAMYKAKKQGKNQYVIFDQAMNSELYTRVIMESNLRAAVDNNELLLYYQPIYCLKTNRIRGFEALVRWNSPVYGLVTPSLFIPLAEETGLILQIGKWVLHTACKFISHINQFRTKKLIISVNISVHQLAQQSFVEDVIEVLKENALDAEFLELEITESIWMEEVESKLEKIDALKKYGVKVAMDDFGTGYSSLTYLKKLPISILKLDKAFIDDISINKNDYDIVKSIIMLANTLGLTVVAEGVEEKDQFDCLIGLGCDLVQGYYISKPLPEEDIEQEYNFN